MRRILIDSITALPGIRQYLRSRQNRREKFLRDLRAALGFRRQPLEC